MGTGQLWTQICEGHLIQTFLQNIKTWTLQWGPGSFGLKYVRVIRSKHFCRISKREDFTVGTGQLWTQICEGHLIQTFLWNIKTCHRNHDDQSCGTVVKQISHDGSKFATDSGLRAIGFLQVSAASGALVGQEI